MVSTPEGITDNIPLTVGTLGNMKKPSSRKSPIKILVLLYAKQKIMSVDLKQLKKITRKSGKVVIYGIVFISG